MNSEPSIIWWDSITGPRGLVSATENAVQEGRSVILRHPGFLPWQDSFRDLAGGAADAVTITQEPAKDAIVPMLLEELAPRYAADCPTSYKNQIEYIKDQHVFRDNTVWIEVGEGVSAQQIIRFISDYRGNDYGEYGAFILSLPESASVPSVSDSVLVLRYQDHVRYSSLRLFASLIVEMDTSVPEKMKSYAAAVLASLCNPDPELLPELLEQMDFQCDEPDEVMLRMWQEEQFLDMGRTMCGKSKWKHPFALLEQRDTEELRGRIWRAQLQILFPEIEIERTEIIDCYYNNIERAIRTKYWDKKYQMFRYVQDTTHYTIEGPYDVEVGTLAFMLAQHTDKEQKEKLWYLPDPQEYERIIFLKDCRNHLAHLSPCTAADVTKLLIREQQTV